MNQLRKIGNWLWLNKERMVLGVMVCILIFRVYQVLNPSAEGEDGGRVQPPRNQFSEDDPRVPGLPPVVPPSPAAEDWSRLWRFSLFTYRQPRQAGPGGPSAPGTDEIELTLVDLRNKPDGSWMAKIQTPSRTTWYDEGEAFEQYTLQKINADTQCVVIFVEAQQKMVDICME